MSNRPPSCSDWRRSASARPDAKVALRVNPDFELKSSGMKMGGGPKQFGIDAEQVPQALAQIGQLGWRSKASIFSAARRTSSRKR